MAQLTTAGKEKNWADGPQAFVDVRNRLVHPEKGEKPKSPEVLFEVLQLGKWYLELTLLRAFEFSGAYAKRLKIPHVAGDAEAVPWATPGHKICQKSHSTESGRGDSSTNLAP